MFTGIIEAIGFVTAINSQGDNKTFWISSRLSNEFKVDQSVSHDGVCLTVEEIKDGQHRVTAIAETLKRSNLGQWRLDTQINLERSIQLSQRLDGHLVQGHVDTTAHCLKVAHANGSWQFTFDFPPSFGTLLIEKGSISINGISLTVFNLNNKTFDVGIIPYTFNHTNINQLNEGSVVNLEFDMIGKYINRIMAQSK